MFGSPIYTSGPTTTQFTIILPHQYFKTQIWLDFTGQKKTTL